MFSNLRNSKLFKFNNDYRFENVIIVFFILLGLIGWQFNYVVSSILIIISAIALIVIYDDFKYGIPASLVLLFSIGNGFSFDTIPFNVVIPVGIFALFIFGYTIYKFSLKKIKSIKGSIGFIILSISFIIPIFWNTVITKEYELFYIMYFSFLLYTILYFLLCLNLTKNSFRIIAFTFTWLAVLLTYELTYTVLKWHFENPDENILDFWGYIGWGLCNEAGIVLCFIMPFVFYEIVKSKNMILSLIALFKLFALGVGIVLTTSRGTYLFGTVEFLILSLFLLILKYKMKLFTISTLLMGGAIAIVGVAIITKSNFISDIINSVFNMNFNANGRDVFWDIGTKRWIESYRNLFFGSGTVSDIFDFVVFDKKQPTFLVYHSTVIEVMVSGGLIGLIGLGIHFAEKYTMLKGKGLAFILLFGAGYFMVDLYGLIDNTYGMYYYMVPLCILMAALSVNNNFELYGADLKYEILY